MIINGHNCLKIVTRLPKQLSQHFPLNALAPSRGCVFTLWVPGYAHWYHTLATLYINKQIGGCYLAETYRITLVAELPQFILSLIH